jgi:hypothetical protein
MKNAMKTNFKDRMAGKGKKENITIHDIKVKSQQNEIKTI